MMSAISLIGYNHGLIRVSVQLEVHTCCSAYHNLVLSGEGAFLPGGEVFAVSGVVEGVTIGGRTDAELGGPYLEGFLPIYDSLCYRLFVFDSCFVLAELVMVIHTNEAPGEGRNLAKAYQHG